MAQEHVEDIAPVDGANPGKEELESKQNLEDAVSSETKKDPSAAAFAALQRREKAVREAEEALKAQSSEVEQLKAKLAELENPKEPEREPLEIRLKKDPLGTLKEMGIGYDTLSEIALNDGQLPQDLQLKMQIEEMKRSLDSKYGSELEQLKAQIAEKEKKEEERKYEATVKNFKAEISDFVSENSDEYELIKLTGSEDMVYDVVAQHYKENKSILSVEEACKAVEQHLDEQLSTLEKSKKLRSKLTPQEQLQEKEGSQALKTLSNEMNQGGSHNVSKSLSREESLARAAKLLAWDE